jgi:hypothetical protein
MSEEENKNGNVLATAEIGLAFTLIIAFGCLLLSINSCLSGDNSTYVTQQSAHVFYAIYYLGLSFLFFKVSNFLYKYGK